MTKREIIKNRLVQNCAALIGIFLISFLFTRIDFTSLADTNISNVIYNFFEVTTINSFFNLVTNYTTGTIYGAIDIALIIFVLRKYKLGVYFLLSAGGVGICIDIIKNILHRSRPFINSIETPYIGNQIPIHYSFPSGHTVLAFFIFIFLLENLNLNKYLKFLLALLTLLVAVSRVYLGAHYFLDVVSGAALGTLLGVIANEILRKYVKTTGANIAAPVK